MGQLLSRILDLSGPIPETIIDTAGDLNYLLTSAAREVLDAQNDDELLGRSALSITLDADNPSMNPINKKILKVYREGIECDEAEAADRLKVKTGSGNLKEATAFSPVFIQDVTVGLPGVGSQVAQLDIFPKMGRDETAEVWYLELPIFGQGLYDINSLESLETNLVNTSHAFWTFDSERAFIIRSAMKILHTRLIESNIEEEDMEVSQLVQATLGSLQGEWMSMLSILKGINPEDVNTMGQLQGGG